MMSFINNFLPQTIVEYLRRHKRKIVNVIFALNILSLWTGFPKSYFYTPPPDWSHKGISKPLGSALQFHNFLKEWDLRVDSYSEEIIHGGRHLKQRLKSYEATLDSLKIQLQNFGYTLDKNLIEIKIPAVVKTATDLMAKKNRFLKTMTDRKLEFQNDIAYYQSQKTELVNALVELLRRGIAMTRSSETETISPELFKVEILEELNSYFLELDQLDNEKALAKLEQNHLPEWIPIFCSLLLMGPRQGIQYIGNELQFHSLKYIKIPSVLKTDSDSLTQYGAWVDEKPKEIAEKISSFERLAIEMQIEITAITDILEVKTEAVNLLVVTVDNFQRFEMPNVQQGSFASHELFEEMNLLKKPVERVMPDLDLSNSIRFQKRSNDTHTLETFVTYL